MMVNSKLQIENSLKKATKDLAGLEIKAEVIISQDLSKGDFSSNVAMTAFRKVKSQMPNIKSPMELAEKIVGHLKLDIGNLKFLDRIEVKEPGFINFFLSNAQIIAGIERLLHGESSIPQKSEVIFEFGDPNPFKEPHIGHLRNLALGESLARLLEDQGSKVIRANYQGDVGAHVAKCLWGILQIENRKLKIENIEKEPLEERIKILSQAYADGAKAYEEDKKAQDQINQINIKIYKEVSKVSGVSGGDGLDEDRLFELWHKGRQWSLDYFETLYKALGIKYDKYYFESDTAPEGLKVVKENSPKVFEKHNGALVFRGEKFGLHTRVFVTAENYATYEGKDLALALMKDRDFPKVGQSIIMTANEQIEYFKVMFAALKLINPKIADKTSHLSFGFVNLKEGKMSSRSGNVVGAFWLIEEVKKRLKKDFREVSDEVLDQLAVGAVKWSMLRFSRQSNISFSIDESIDLAGNSGPYMQYTYARISSLLEKSSVKDFEAKSVKNLNGQLIALGRLICQFETQIKMAADTFSPNVLTNYLYSLAQNFNNYYEREKIIGTEDEKEKLAVVNAVGEVIKKGLYLLGIDAPKKI